MSRLGNEVLDYLSSWYQEAGPEGLSTTEIAEELGVTFIDAKEVLVALESRGDVQKVKSGWRIFQPES